MVGFGGFTPLILPRAFIVPDCFACMPDFSWRPRSHVIAPMHSRDCACMHSRDCVCMRMPSWEKMRIVGYERLEGKTCPGCQLDFFLFFLFISWILPSKLRDRFPTFLNTLQNFCRNLLRKWWDIGDKSSIEQLLHRLPNRNKEYFYSLE